MGWDGRVRTPNLLPNMAKVKIFIGEELWRYNYSKAWSDSNLVYFDEMYRNDWGKGVPESVYFAMSYGIDAVQRERETTPNLDGLIVKDYFFIEEDKATEFLLKWKWKSLSGK